MALSDCPRCWDTPCTCGYEREVRIYYDRIMRYRVQHSCGKSVPYPIPKGEECCETHSGRTSDEEIARRLGITKPKPGPVRDLRGRD